MAEQAARSAAHGHPRQGCSDPHLPNPHLSPRAAPLPGLQPQGGKGILGAVLDTQSWLYQFFACFPQFVKLICSQTRLLGQRMCECETEHASRQGSLIPPFPRRRLLGMCHGSLAQAHTSQGSPGPGNAKTKLCLSSSKMLLLFRVYYPPSAHTLPPSVL